MIPTATKSVLVVDDNAYIRKGLRELFKRETDFEVCGEAQNGKEAIDKAQELHPDLIVLDLCMPVMDAIKRQKPKPSSGDCVNRLAQVQL